MSVRDTVTARLTGDAALSALLSGGIYRASDVRELSRQSTPAAFDTDHVLHPCALLRFSTVAAAAPHVHGARLYLDVALFDEATHADILAAQARIYALLHDWAVGAGGYVVRHNDDSAELEEPVTQWAMLLSRYQVDIMRSSA